jgi:hypothetical protein
MSSRLAAGLLVSALIRRAETSGGSAMVLARGEPTAGAILIQLADRGTPGDLLERQLDHEGAYRWSSVGPSDRGAVEDYLTRRRRNDPDLWVVEIDSPIAATLVEEVTGQPLRSS